MADTRAAGRRVVAVGTTVVRALESAAVSGSGWTDLVITPERGVRMVDGLRTGWHEPATSGGGPAAAAGLLCRGTADRLPVHEIGDLHLILPR